VVHGGFDGQQELPSMHLCTISGQAQQQQEAAAAAAGADVPEAGGEGGGDGGGALEGRWQAVEYRSLIPPPGRCHHSICYDPRGGCLYIFGGYSSRCARLLERGGRIVPCLGPGGQHRSRIA
jgi:hypothetical protein